MSLIGLVAVYASAVDAQTLPEASGSDRVLQSVDSQRSADGWRVSIQLSIPLRYVRHTPRGHAALAIIELQSIGLERTEGGQPVGHQAIRPFGGANDPPILEISTNPAGPRDRVIEIRFLRDLPYEVSQGSDLRQLHIDLPRAGDPAAEARAAQFLSAGRDAMTNGEYDRAAQLYTKALTLNAPAAHPEAQEMLGLARERNGQRAHARAEYETFLDSYPDHADAPRVRQRLQAITTASEPVPEPRFASNRRSDDDLRFDLHGGIASYYSRSEIYFDDGFGSAVTDQSWINDLYLNARLRTRAYEIQASAAGRARLDFEGGDVGNDSRVNAFLLEAEQRGSGFWGNIGRQRGGGGVTGRFDGMRLGYRPNDNLDFQVLGGFPLASYSSDDFNTDRFQVGSVGQVLDVYSLFDVELYSNYQNEDDLTYRAALGGQIRHLREGRSIVASLDYDAYFNAINIAMLLADIEVMEGLSVNTLVEYRKSPILTLGNALIGQTAGSVSDLHDAFSASQMKDLAEDRTADATNYTLGARYSLNDRFDLSGNWTASKLSGTPGSGGVLGTPSTDYNFTYYAQIAGRALLMDRGVSVVGVRIFDGDRLDAYMLQLNGRYPVAPKLRLNPIMRLEYLDGDEDDQVRWIPRLRFDYTWYDVVFEVDAAFEMLQSVGGADRPNEYGYSLFAGLRYDF